MMELIQFPWSPFCLVQKRILDYSGVRYKLTNIPCTDRSLVWGLTRERYYQVPILRDDGMVLFETNDTSQVLAKFLDSKLHLGLFPPEYAGLQRLVWEQIEDRVEGLTFRLNDIYYREFVPRDEQLEFLRFKERKFGRGCLQQWHCQEASLRDQLARVLLPYEQMLQHHPFLLDSRPRFVDFDLYGMVANLLYSGHHHLPPEHTRLQRWYERISQARFSDFNGRLTRAQLREKLHS